MYSIRLGSRLRNGELAPLLDDDIAAIEQEEHRRAARAEINRLIREVHAELAAESEHDAPEVRESETSNVVPLRLATTHDQDDVEAA